MSYVDPDQLHGVMTDLATFITNNSTKITAKGGNPTTLSTSLNGIQTDLSGKKGIRDQKKTDLKNAQQIFADAASNNYAAFSDLIDVVSGTFGKHTPEGQQVLAYRARATGGAHHAKTATAAASSAPTP